jgi:hypothetical protein
MMVLRTLQKIDEIHGRINTHPEYSQRIKREELAGMKESAEKHSLEMEFLSGEHNKKSVDKLRAKHLGVLQDAWNHLSEQGISLYSLSSLGNIVAPLNHTYRDFRKVATLFGEFSPPESQKVHGQVDNLLWVLDKSHMHPVSRAAEAHLEIVRIHPYEDGNGRVARLLQNFCLAQRGYPPALIPSEERKEYLKIIGNSLRGRYAGKGSIHNLTSEDELFHRYIESKVLTSISELENSLKTRRTYSIKVSDISNRAIIHSIAKKLRNSGKINDSKGVSVRVNRNNGGRNGATLEVIGDIGLDQLNKSMRVASDKYSVKYEVNSNTNC